MKVNRLLVGTLALVLIAGLGTPAFAQVYSGSGTPTPGSGAVATISQTASSTCVVLDFEGVGDIIPVGTIGDVTFSANALGVVDSDAGGSGNIANEPSPDTVMFVSTGSNTITATLASPVNEISWNYASAIPAEIRVFGAGNVLLATIALPAIAQVNPGDPTGFFSTWDSGFHTEVGNVITSVEYDGTTNNIVWDDLNYCVFTVVGGELLPIDTTALMLAGLQSSAIWMLPILAGAAGASAYYIKTRMNKDN